MLKELLKNKKFRRIAEEALKQGSVLDIIIFGSVVREKEVPADIDLMILYANKEDVDHTYSLRKKFENGGFKVHLIGQAYPKLFSSSFLAREDILLEGYSLRNNGFISELFGFKTIIMFRYYLKELNNSQRMQFYYALHGRRGEKGVLENFDSFRFADKVIISSLQNSYQIQEFFRSRKIHFEEIKFLIPKRVANKKFLEQK